ncbi:hypothetical protein OPV22_002239 [Ensete ventricosum]|uniref:Uncharacterized protein n=1 Tax=Ensete ventricosum TaxID=4639 RepID=A0AAV8RXE0_ENSVE|nr:hypothetical protein OPV22_002239 [Ensete ventricosum]
MSSKIGHSHLPLFHKLPAKNLSFEPAKPLRFRSRACSPISSSYTGPSKQESTGKVVPAPEAYSVEFETLEGCKLGISRYPDFEYNAKGGAGNAVGRKDRTDDMLCVSFDVGTLYIPPLTGATTKFLGLPLPPLLKIAIVPEAFQGTISKGSGKVELMFRARFLFSVGSIYRAPPLMVETTLTSEESRGTMRAGRGERMDEEGRCKLVGVALVDPIDDALMNAFLRLPTECIAMLNAKISIPDP